MYFLPPYFYAIFTPLSVRASEDLATADKLFPGALYVRTRRDGVGYHTMSMTEPFALLRIT